MKERLTAVLVACSLLSVASAIPITSLNNSDVGPSNNFTDLVSTQIRPALDVGSDQAQTSVQEGVLPIAPILVNQSASAESQVARHDPPPFFGASTGALSVNNAFTGNREIHLGRKEVPNAVSVPDRFPTGLLMCMAFLAMVLVKSRFLRRRNLPLMLSRAAIAS